MGAHAGSASRGHASRTPCNSPHKVRLPCASASLCGPAMLDAHRLRVFRAVVAAGSINGAAASLGYTPSAVSQHVAALQRETGLALVERNGRGIVPTPAGRHFADE